MRKPGSMWSLETFGRQRLSRYFFMRDFMYSEISGFHGVPNVPENPDLVLENGRAFCAALMDPLEETFCRIAVRSGYRSPTLNRYGNENRLTCARNDHPLECHIWDRGAGMDAIAGASIVISVCSSWCMVLLLKATCDALVSSRVPVTKATRNAIVLMV